MSKSSPNVDTSQDKTPVVLTSVTAEQVSNAIKAAGCAVTAVEEDNVIRLHSASHGVGFQVLWGNALPDGQFVDFTLSCPLRVQGGELPDGISEEWHRSRRFARVARHGDFVVLEMDVVVAGGVGEQHLAFVMQLWTQMMGQFFLHMRNVVSRRTDVGEGEESKGRASQQVADAGSINS